MKKLAALLALIFAAATPAAPRNLEIYWIDAEGGAATLIISPSGESMLVDTANRTPDDRDAKRIFAVTQLAGRTMAHRLSSTAQSSPRHTRLTRN
jgi:hypothetical protein